MVIDNKNKNKHKHKNNDKHIITRKFKDQVPTEFLPFFSYEKYLPIIVKG